MEAILTGFMLVIFLAFFILYMMYLIREIVDMGKSIGMRISKKQPKYINYIDDSWIDVEDELPYTNEEVEVTDEEYIDRGTFYNNRWHLKDNWITPISVSYWRPIK